VEVLTDFPERFAPGARMYVGPEDLSRQAPVEATVRSARPQQARLLVAFDLAEDREAAAGLTGQFLYVPVAEAHLLEPDSYYAHELVGLEVRTDAGAVVGEVGSLLEAGGTDVLWVRSGERDVLIPMIAEVVLEVDLAAGRITIFPMPGLLEGASSD
jgi:16S rRNA processing protein RimM